MVETRFMMPWGATAFLIAVGLVGCGDDAETSVGAADDEVARLESAAFAHGVADPELVDEPRPIEVGKFGEPKGLVHERSSGSNKAEAHETEDDPRFVRETGFREIIEPLDEVRETGFLPAPVLHLVAVYEGRAFLSWTSIEGADKYLLVGLRYNDEGRPVESFMKDFRSQRGWVDGRGRLTRVSVIAVSNDNALRSKPSNEVEISAEDL